MIDIIKNKIKKNSIFINYKYNKTTKNQKKYTKNEKDEEIFKFIRELKTLGVNVIYFELPKENKVKLTNFQKQRVLYWIFDFNKIKFEENQLKKIYGKNVDINEIKELCQGINIAEYKGKKILTDYRSDKVNILNGMRFTTDTPQNEERKIHVFGGCMIRGVAVPDKNTICSCLQRNINSKYGNFRVYNHAIGCGSTIEDDLAIMKSISYSSEDTVIICNSISLWLQEEFAKNNIASYELSEAFNKINKEEWFTDSILHTTSIGNRMIADYMFKSLDEKKILGATRYNRKIVYKGIENSGGIKSDELLEYTRKLNKEYKKSDKNNCGSIIMNCNPFTNGHLYLIEYAAKLVDFLYIFVVQEDKSFFPFKDRFELVKKGTKHLKNICVLPSGKFVLSAATFPGYFTKENNSDVVVDTSMDIETFCQSIAPTLNIKVRFAGEEPIDMITKQYNDTMRDILPQYGMEFHEIKRKNIDETEDVISASKVREYLKNKEFDKIEKIVPKTTYEYLIEKFGDK